MVNMQKKEMEEITQAIEREFPEDPALQQIHIARKMIACEAEFEGLGYFEYLQLYLQKSRLNQQTETA